MHCKNNYALLKELQHQNLRKITIHCQQAKQLDSSFRFATSAQLNAIPEEIRIQEKQLKYYLNWKNL